MASDNCGKVTLAVVAYVLFVLDSSLQCQDFWSVIN